MFHQILSALLYLKRLGVSHSSLKPQNIMLDKDRNIKLVDFDFDQKTDTLDRNFKKTVHAIPFNTPPEILL